MAVEVTENWSARQLTLDYDVMKWRASRTLCVAYAQDEMAAIAAAEGGAAGVYPLGRGIQHPLTSNMVCGSVSVDRQAGLNVFLVTGEYAWPNFTLELSPLLQPPR